MSRDAGIDLFFANLSLGKTFTWSHPKFYQYTNLDTDKYKTLSDHRVNHLYLRNIDLSKNSNDSLPNRRPSAMLPFRQQQPLNHNNRTVFQSHH